MTRAYCHFWQLFLMKIAILCFSLCDCATAVRVEPYSPFFIQIDMNRKSLQPPFSTFSPPSPVNKLHHNVAIKYNREIPYNWRFSGRRFFLEIIRALRTSDFRLEGSTARRLPPTSPSDLVSFEVQACHSRTCSLLVIYVDNNSSKDTSIICYQFILFYYNTYYCLY